MPRTKINRKVLANKRARRSSFEERRETKLKEFDTLVYEFQAEMEEEFRNCVENITGLISGFRQKTSNKVLGITLHDLKRLAGKTLCEVTMTASQHSQPSGNSADISTLGSLSLVGDKIGEKKKTGHSDQGYLTETSPSRSSGSSIQSNTSSKSRRPLGPLASSKAMRSRRSKSEGPNTASKILPVSMSNIRGTPLQTSTASHVSRSKYKTPMNNQRLKTCSVDRLLITPKVQPNTPMAILRRANVGETVYSISGSPVITSSGIEDTANVNIPVTNGILSIRPTEMGSIDPKILTRIDSTTIDHLKQLQSNLDKLMKAAGYSNKFKLNG